MKILDPSEHTPMAIDKGGTRKLEAFLNRNFPHWRESECHKEKNAGTIHRHWMVGIDDMERIALYRGRYVEICDQCFVFNEVSQEIEICYGQHRICDIKGDLTPVAVWGNRKSQQA